jgi:LEA14-like dessication related protein
MITAFLIISILLSLALWVQPPNITVSNPVQNDTQSFTFQNNELAFNLAANITVDNPNYFGVSLNKVELDLTYPINNYPVGGGEQQHINIRSNAQTNFTFPFSLNYNVSDTTGAAVLQDIVTKCRGNQALTVSYALKLSLRVVIVSVSPTINNSFTIKCPVDADDIEKLLGGTLGS